MALLLRIVCVLAFALTLHVACAQSYPSKPIRIVIGFPPGGGIDLVARLRSPKLTDSRRPTQSEAGPRNSLHS
jgi:tripartite-type tricarboxylate transporter receptor subunit TctC